MPLTLLFLFFEGKFIKTMAKESEQFLPTGSEILSLPTKQKAMVTETGSSSDETVLPKSQSCIGKPTLNKIGGIIVPKEPVQIHT